MAEKSGDLVTLSADIVAAYVSKNHVQVSEIPALLSSIHAALNQAATGIRTDAPAKPEPVIPPGKSVKNDHIVCLFDGLRFKSLKRHIRTSHEMTPQQYREAFGLRPDYPMVAPAYAESRSALAKKIGLGQNRKKAGTKSAAKTASTAKTKRSKKA